VLGVLPAAKYEQGQLPVHSGDRLVLYTDGITEARNDADEEFGEDRLLAFAVEHRTCSAPALQARLGAFVTAFTGGRLQDDATLIVVAVD
jgi:sigma-B regulation protein RsbU (phosphoserine phosphatase)